MLIQKEILQNIQVAKLLRYCQLLRNDIFLPKALLLNQTLSIFQTN